MEGMETNYLESESDVLPLDKSPVINRGNYTQPLAFA
jgi:hypothetical protein